MNITEVKVFPVAGNEKLKAYVKLTFDDAFVVKDIKVIKGPGGYFVSMPSKRLKDGGFMDIIHPVNKGAREMLERAVMDEYKRAAGAAA